MKVYFPFILFLFISYQCLCQPVGNSKIYISDISIGGNKSVKNITILRELALNEGETLTLQELNREIKISRDNLQNTSLFNTIHIKYELLKPDGNDINPDFGIPCKIRIEVQERWYYWPWINIKLEDRNLSSWLKNFDMNRVTLDLGLKIDNINGVGQKMILGCSVGYERSLMLSYKNIILDSAGKNIIGGKIYTHSNKTSNFGTSFNKPLYIKSDKKIDRATGINLNYTYRADVRIKHTFSLNLEYSKINDSILFYNPYYWGHRGNTDFTYTVKYKFENDQRNYYVYPTSGYYLSAEEIIMTGDKCSQWSTRTSTTAQYFKPLNKRWFLSGSLKLSASASRKRSYILERVVGYDGVSICGYDYYVIDGQHFGVFNSTVKFLLLPKTEKYFKCLRNIPKFNPVPLTIYIKAMGDAGYIRNSHAYLTNNMCNSMLLGTGIGIDCISYYDMLFSLSYCINRSGTRGIYFGINIPIM